METGIPAPRFLDSVRKGGYRFRLTERDYLVKNSNVDFQHITHVALAAAARDGEILRHCWGKQHAVKRRKF